MATDVSLWLPTKMADVFKLKAVAATTRFSLLVRESIPFWLRVATRSRRLARYRLRGSNIVVYLRHGTVDVLTLDEILGRGHHYQLPPHVAEVLERIRRPLRVVDLGANIGVFGAFVRRLYPDAVITAFEPHPANIEVLRKTIAANGGEERWRLVAACADVREKTVRLAIGNEFTTARVDDTADTSIAAPAVDVFPFLTDVDLLKIDIEGSEWRLLDDPRFVSIRARAVALEYHAHGCPGGDPRRLAREQLQKAGYETADAAFEAVGAGNGMLWAWRPQARPPE